MSQSIKNFDDGPFYLSKSADSVTQARWLQGWVRWFAEDHAIAAVAGIHMQEPCGEAGVILACIQRAELMGIPRETAIAGARAAWRAAMQKTDFIEQAIRRAVVPLAREQAPGQAILNAATKAADGTGAFVPSQVILDLARRIAHGAAARVRR